jgi:4-hydroxy-tetrahydrodipicolinate synthase
VIAPHPRCKLQGSLVALPTPFRDGRVNLPALHALVDFHIERKTDGLVVCGTTGEAPTLEEWERRAVVEASMFRARGRFPIVAGVGTNDTRTTVNTAKAAVELGVDALLVVTPYYNRPTQRGLEAHFGAVAQAVTTPIVLYNVPSRTAVDVAPETLARLRGDFDNVVGIKETTKDFEHFSRVLHLCGRDTLVWSGIELLCLPLLAIGGVGFVSAVANLAPAAVARMYELWTAGAHDQALDIHYGLHPLVDLLFVETNPAPAKWVLERAGLIASGSVRPPLVDLTPAGQTRVLGLLAQGGALLKGPVKP